MAQEKAATYKPADRLAKATIILLAIKIVFSLCTIGTELFEAVIGREIYPLFDRSSDPVMIVYGMFETVLTFFDSYLYLVIAALFLMWVFRTRQNLTVLGLKGFSTTPGWAVGWFLAPIFCYWKPYLPMRELWQASEASENITTEEAWKNRPVPPLLAGWWASWIAANVLLFGISNYMLTADRAKIDPLVSSLIYTGASVCEIVAAMLLIKIVQHIQATQKSRCQSNQPFLEPSLAA